MHKRFSYCWWHPYFHLTFIQLVTFPNVKLYSSENLSALGCEFVLTGAQIYADHIDEL